MITDESYRFDEIAAGYEGQLYLEVVPLSFPVRVREDLSLNQLRLSVGSALLTDDDVRAFHNGDPLLFHHGEPVAGGEARVRRRPVPRPRSARRRPRLRRAPRARQRAAARRREERGRAGRSRTVLGVGAARGRRPRRAHAAALLPADEQRSGVHPADAGVGDDGVRPDERRAAHALRGVLRSRLRLRPGRALDGIARRARSARARRAVHDRARPTRLQAHVRTDARGARTGSTGRASARTTRVSSRR